VEFDVQLLEKDDSSGDDQINGSFSAPFELGWRRSIEILLPAGSTQCVAHVSLQPI
jgi:hypothetical protein